MRTEEPGPPSEYLCQVKRISLKPGLGIRSFALHSFALHSFAQNQSPLRATVRDLLLSLFKKENRERIALVSLYKSVTRANRSLTKSEVSDLLVF